MSFGVYKSILSNDTGTGIAQDHQVPVRDILPNLAVVSFIVNADRYYFGILGIKVGFPLRELAQLVHAKGSPVSTIEIQHNSAATLGSEIEIVSRSVLQSEIRSSSLGSVRNL